MPRHGSSPEFQRYLEAELSQGRTEELTAHIEECSSCAQALAAERRLLDALRNAEAEIDSVDLAKDMRLLVAAAPSEPTSRPGWKLWGSGALVASAAIVIAFASLPTEDSEFKPKGRASTDDDTWVGIEVYEVGGSEARSVDGEIESMTPLVIAYRNLDPIPFTHLMVFAVDAVGETRWFYPAHDRNEDPTSISIEPKAEHVLSEQISHSYADGALDLYGLFTRGPLRVSDVERAVKERTGDRLAIPDAGQHHIRLWVTR